MRLAFATALRRADKVVLIGSDCPGYDTSYLRMAFDALDRYDAVIGPAHDGGYVLIGLTRIDRQLFEDIPWSTPRVLEKTHGRLQALGWRWTELATLRDLDQPEDLVHFPGLTKKLIDCAAHELTADIEN